MTYRVGIVGCGGVSRCHARAYRNDPRMALVAGADPREEARTKFGAEFGVPIHSTGADMIRREKLDIVSVCTRHREHHAATLEAAGAGARAIICEKPLAMNLTEADEMLRACRARGATLIVSHQRRFQPVYEAFAAPIFAGELGRLTDIYFEMPYWDLMGWGTHAIDLIRWYNGDAPTTTVFGQIDADATHERFGHKVEDSSLVHMRFANGVAATLTGGAMAKAYHQRVYGEEGELFFEEIWGDPPRYTMWVRRHDAAAPRAIPRPPTDTMQAGFDGMVRALGDSLQTGARHTLGGESARETLAIIMAAYESSRRRRAVSFPVDIPDNPFLDMPARRPKARA